MSIDFRESSYSNSSFDALVSAASKGRSAEEIARELIARSVSRSSNISLVYRELLRSVLHAFSGFSIQDYQENLISVQSIHATQERAIAKLTEETNLILQIISIDQPKSLRDEKRQRYKPLIVSEKYWDEKKKRAIRLISLVPAPVNIEYEAIVWCKYKSDLDQITEQIHSIFNPDLEIITPFATNIKLYLKEEATESELIAADREDRILKRVFRIFASTYIPSPKFMMTSTGQIEDFNYEIELASGGTKQTFESFLGSEENMPDPNALFNASALFGYPIASGNPSSAGSLPALVWNGQQWSASDIFVQFADLPTMLFSASSLYNIDIDETSVSSPTLYDALVYDGSKWVASTVTATGTFVTGDYATLAGSATVAASASTASALLGSSISNQGLTSGASLVWNGQQWAASALYLRVSEIPSIVTNASALLGYAISSTLTQDKALTWNGSNWVTSSTLLKLSDVTGLVMNASALLASSIASNPTIGAALVYYGNSWAASDTFLKASDIAQLTAKVDSMDWGARYYRPDFVKLAYVSQYGTGETGGEVEGQGNSDLWTGTSAYGEIARWFIPEMSFRGQGVLDVDITGYFDASVTPTVDNYTLVNLPSIYVANYFFSGVTVPSSYTFINTSATGEIINPDDVSATRLRFMINRGGAYSGPTFPAGYTAASSYIMAGVVRCVSAGANNNNQCVVFSKNNDLSALNENSYFTVTENYSSATSGTFPQIISAAPASPYPNATYYKAVSGAIYDTTSIGSKLVSSLVSIYKAGPPASGAVLLTSSDSFNGSAGDTLIFYQVNANFSSLAAGTIANVSSYIELATDVSAASSLSAILNADSNFTAATGLNLSSYIENNKLALAYQGTTDNYQWGVLGTLVDKLGLSASANTYYKHAYRTKTEGFDWKYNGGSFTGDLASSVAVFEIQMADDPFDGTLDYTDLPYGVNVSTLGYPVYDPSGNAYLGNVNTSTLYSITYQAPPSAIGVPGVATRGFPQPWTTIATFETGVSSFPNVYSINRGDFNVNIKFRSAGFFGATYYQPYVVEITQASGVEAVSKKIINRTTMDVTKDKMMRVRFRCIQYASNGQIVYFTDFDSPYNYGVIPRVCTVTTLAATLSCPGDGHPF